MADPSRMVSEIEVDTNEHIIQKPFDLLHVIDLLFPCIHAMPQPKGLYADSSISSCAGEEEGMGRCECGNMIKLDLDLDAAVHPTTRKVGVETWVPSFPTSARRRR